MAKAYYYEGDRKPYLRVTLTRGGSAIDVSASAVTFKLYRKGREAYEAPVASGAVAPVDAPNGIVEYQWGAGDLDTPGNFSGVFVLDGEEGIPDGGYVEVVVRGAGS